MRTRGKFILIAAVIAFAAMPMAVEWTPLSGTAHAQKPERAGKGRGGPPVDVPRHGGDRFDRDEDRFGRGGDRFDHGSSGLCPPGLEGQGCFPSGAQKFRNGFCPPGLEDKGCMPPGLHGFARGDRFPRDIRYNRVYYRDYGLMPPGPGQFYARIDQNVYLVSEGDRRVLEAISLLGAARR